MYKAKRNFNTEEGEFKIGDKYEGIHTDDLLAQGLLEEAEAKSVEAEEDLVLEQEEEDFGESEKASKKKKKGK